MTNEPTAEEIERVAKEMYNAFIVPNSFPNTDASEYFTHCAQWHLAQLAQVTKERDELVAAKDKTLRVILMDFSLKGKSIGSFSEGEYTEDYTTRKELIERTLRLTPPTPP